MHRATVQVGNGTAHGTLRVRAHISSDGRQASGGDLLSKHSKRSGCSKIQRGKGSVLFMAANPAHEVMVGVERRVGLATVHPAVVTLIQPVVSAPAAVLVAEAFLLLGLATLPAVLLIGERRRVGGALHRRGGSEHAGRRGLVGGCHGKFHGRGGGVIGDNDV